MTSPYHKRNKYQGSYNLDDLVRHNPALKPYILSLKHREDSIDFSNQKAVYELNKALILAHFDLSYWDIQNSFLVPAVPSRAEYIHYIADLLATENNGKLAEGNKITMLDIGTGASMIYPIIATNHYKWSCLGTDINTQALQDAEIIILKNPKLKPQVQLRHQLNASNILRDIVLEESYFDCVICNPPFYKSQDEADKANKRKIKNLGIRSETKRNFSGTHQELWTEGGELAFVHQMIEESKLFATQCLWFSSLISNEDHLPILKKSLRKIKATAIKSHSIEAGQKKMNVIAWSFLNDSQRKAWARYRFIS